MTVSGRCYCGHVTLSAPDPLTTAYCHCSDCKRWTGAPLPAFSAVASAALSVNICEKTYETGVQRRNCPDCGSPLTARFDYLPGQIYIPIGVLDTIADHPPAIHCHADKQLSWLHLHDDTPRTNGSGRDQLLDPTR